MTIEIGTGPDGNRGLMIEEGPHEDDWKKHVHREILKTGEKPYPDVPKASDS